MHIAEAPRRAPHQREGHLCHGGIAIALDDMHLHAAFGSQFLGVHVGTRAGAQKDDVFQIRAALDDRQRAMRMVIDHDLHALQRTRQIIRRNIGRFVNSHRQIIRAMKLAHHGSE